MIDRLDYTIKAAGIPIAGLSGPNGGPIVVNPPSLQAAAQPIIDTFDWSQAAQDAWLEQLKCAAVGGINYRRLAVPRSTNVGPAWSNVTGLSFPLMASRHYAFAFDGAYTTAAAATGLQLAVTGPVTPAMFVAGIEIAESVTAWRNAGVTAYDTGGNGTASAGATPLPFHVFGNISTGAAGGNLQLRFRTEVNGSQVTIGAGSYATLSAVVS
jgi:hypothetical protein